MIHSDINELSRGKTKYKMEHLNFLSHLMEGVMKASYNRNNYTHTIIRKEHSLIKIYWISASGIRTTPCT